MTHPPLASIVMAAYDRADVMAFAIRSVLNSTYENWELIVIGDGCTDHSPDVVSGFADPRITFENLSENSGGQAAPNNHGIARARGEFVLFLNQDDMFLPDHVDRSVAHLQSTGADISWCPVVLFERSGQDAGLPDPVADRLVLDGVVNDHGYDPRQFYLASSWAMRRSAAAHVGAWTPEAACRVTPSQDWLFRASQSELVMSYRKDPTVIAIHSGTRRLSYLKTSAEHERAWSWIAAGPAGLARVFSAVATTVASDLYATQKTAQTHIDRQIVDVAGHFGVHPNEVSRFLQGQAAGDYIRQIRSHTAEPQVLARNTVVQAGANASDPFFSDGWHGGEGSHRWSGTPHAELLFETETDIEFVELTVSPRMAGQGVQLIVDGAAPLHFTLNDTETIRAPLRHAECLHRVVVAVDACVSPRDMALGDDTRPLGVSLHSFRTIA